MRIFSELQKTSSLHLSLDTLDARGDESLISDVRSQMKSTDLVERKLQNALQATQLRGCRMSLSNSQ